MRRFILTAVAVLSAGSASSGSAQLPGPVCSDPGRYEGGPVRAPLTVGVSPAPTTGTSPLPAATQAALATAFDRAFEATGAASMTAAVLTERGLWSAQRGAPDTTLHYWASVGKMVTAAAILQLESHGRLTLDDAIGSYVEGVPNGDVITLRMLLNHTSGLVSANEDEAVRERGAPLGLDEELAVLRRRGPQACPGAVWRYSNSGYRLLGVVIQRVTDEPYPSALQSLVFDHSRATRIRVLRRDESRADIAPPTGETAFDVRRPQAAGGVVADATSMVLLLHDLLGGRIIDPGQVERMTRTLYPMFEDPLWYGLGLMVFDVADPEGERVWIGHSGGVPGARAVVAYDPLLGAIAAVALTGEGSAEASANLLFRHLAGAR
jgi:D-alanyl-D-alanine carboxypeptidase